LLHGYRGRVTYYFSLVAEMVLGHMPTWELSQR